MSMLNKFLKNSSLDRFSKRLEDLRGELIKEFNHIADEWNEAEGDINEALSRTFATIRKRIKNFNEKFVVEVPYDRDTQCLSSYIKDRYFIVKVWLDTTDDTVVQRTETRTLLPENVLIDEVLHEYDSENKKMVFTFKKSIADPLDDREVEEEIADRVEEVTTEPLTIEVVMDEETPTDSHTPSGKEMIENIKKTMYEMYQSGASYKTIASEFGLSDKTVARWINAFIAKMTADEAIDDASRS